MISHILAVCGYWASTDQSSFVDLKTWSNIVLLNMASVKRLSLITKYLAALLAMASFPYDTQGVPNNHKNNSIVVFQDENIVKMERPLGESGKQLTLDARKRSPQVSVPGCDCNCGCGMPNCNCPESLINDYCCKVGDGTSVCCNIAGRNILPGFDYLGG